MMKKLLAMGLCAVLMLLTAVPVAAEEQTNVQWTEFNSIIVELVTEKSCSFTPEDFPEVDCIATITGEKHVDDEGVHYVVVLVLSQSGDAAVEEAIAKAKTNPMVLYAGTNNSHELWDYQFSLNHSNYVLRLGETVDVRVTDTHSPVMPGVVRCIRFVVDRNYIDDNEENIVETFAKYGINHFWIDREYHEGDSRYENIRSEQGVYFASVEPGRTSYEMIAPLTQSDGFKEVEFVMGWITGGVSLDGTWSIDKPALADMIPSENGGVTIHALKPGIVVVTRKQNYYYNCIQTCEILIVPEGYTGFVDADHIQAFLVDEMIEDLPDEITPANQEQVKATEKAYNDLTEEQKGLVKAENKNTLKVALAAIVPQEKPQEYPKKYMMGDMNGDGILDAKDALDVLQHAVGKYLLSEDLVDWADMNGDDAINAKDALMILKKAVGK